MVANIIIDLILLLLLAVGGIWGWKSGFIEMVSKPVKFVLTIIISLSLASVVGAGIVQPMISEPVTNQISGFLTEKCAEITAATASTELPTLVKLAAALADIDIDAIASEAGQAELIHEITLAVTEPVLGIIAVVIAYVALHILSSIVLAIVFGIVNECIKNGDGLVSRANSILGCFIMTIMAAIVVWVLCGFSDFILHLPVFHEQAWVESFTGGFIYNFFKGLSPVELLLSF